MSNKKAFTLIEILISIVLLVIIVLFLYQALDLSTKSNKFFSQKLLIQEDKTKLKKIFFSDIVHCYSKKTKISEDRDEKTIFQLKSTNTYHDSFYNHITYFISKEDNLIRCESKKIFNKEKLFDDFFDKAYIDIIATNVKNFKVIQKDKKQHAIYLKFKDESDMMFVFKSMR